MTSTTKPIPEGSSVVMPMLVCRDALAELEFCKAAFGALSKGVGQDRTGRWRTR